tara:strand:- start:191 stop:772 length:582 start_codon:yes stop_codon:yes gene_type:complete
MESLSANYDKFGNILDTLFLLFLGTAGGMVGNAVLNCGIQESIAKSQYMKHIVFFVIIYFTNSFVKSQNKPSHPLMTLLKTVIIYATFILLMKTEKTPFLAAIVTCGGLYVLREYRDYLVKTNDGGKNDAVIGNIEKSSTALLALILIVIVVGAFMYYRRQKGDKGGKFDHMLYFFGTNNCDYESRPVSRKKI